VPSFSWIDTCVSGLWPKIAKSVQNEDEKKNKGMKIKFCFLISWDWMERLASNLVAYLWGISTANLV